MRLPNWKIRDILGGILTILGDLFIIACCLLICMLIHYLIFNLILSHFLSYIGIFPPEQLFIDIEVWTILGCFFWPIIEMMRKKWKYEPIFALTRIIMEMFEAWFMALTWPYWVIKYYKKNRLKKHQKL
jgi:hypothetical protein